MTDNGLRFLMSKEGYRQQAYLDKASKVWTIGYGNTYWPNGTKVKKGDKLVSKADAFNLLKSVISTFENSIKNSLTIEVYNTLNDNQKDALTSLSYNIGVGNFNKSTVCSLVKNNKDDHNIRDAFMMWNKSGGKVLNGLTKRRAEEAAMYFGEHVNIPDIDLTSSGTISTSSGTVAQYMYDPNFGDNNMFYELSNNPDWTVTPFKKYPRRSNDWSSLVVGPSCPKVGDLLFSFHDGASSGNHHHVAIYLGMHDGKKYVAEGKSRRGNKIYEATNSGVQVIDIGKSRLSLDSDIITHFAHCNSANILQTSRRESQLGLCSNYGSHTDFSNINYRYAPVVGEDKMKHFTLIDKNNEDKSSLIYSKTAHSNKINNVPSTQQRQNLVNLVNYLLDPLYEAVEAAGIGKLFVSSGFRNHELNSRVHGEKDSQHISGEAADIQISGCKGSAGNALLKVAQLLISLEASGFSYDQLIFEGFNNDEDYQALRPSWLHMSFKSKEKNKRYSDPKKLLCWKENRGYKTLTPDEVLSKPTT